MGRDRDRAVGMNCEDYPTSKSSVYGGGNGDCMVAIHSPFQPCLSLTCPFGLYRSL
jgi:hypothetical protein